MESKSQELMRHLNRDNRHAKQHFKKCSRLVAQLRKELQAKQELQLVFLVTPSPMAGHCCFVRWSRSGRVPALLQVSAPERWGAFSYRTEQSEARPLPKYLRRDQEGHEEVVLDVNNLNAGGSFASIGQLKLSADQTLVAYTLDTDGSEAFEACVQAIAGAHISGTA